MKSASSGLSSIVSFQFSGIRLAQFYTPFLLLLFTFTKLKFDDERKCAARYLVYQRLFDSRPSTVETGASEIRFKQSNCEWQDQMKYTTAPQEAS